MTETERQTDRDSGGDRQTDRQTDRQSGGERERESQLDSDLHGGQTDTTVHESVQ